MVPLLASQPGRSDNQPIASVILDARGRAPTQPDGKYGILPAQRE